MQELASEQYHNFIKDSPETRQKMMQQIQYVTGKLASLPFSVCVSDPLLEDTPIIGTSKAFLMLCGRDFREIIGKNCRLLLEGVPAEEISRSARKDSRNYCTTARLRNLASLPNMVLLQRNARKNGELFYNYIMLGALCGPGGRILVAGLQIDMGNMVDKITVADQAAAVDAHQENMRVVQRVVFGETGPSSDSFATYPGMAPAALTWDDASVFEGTKELPLVAWPRSRAVMRNRGVSVLRRDGGELPRGAATISLLPAKVHKDGSVSCAIRVEAVSPRWCTEMSDGAFLPYFGFTTRTPKEMERDGLPEQIEFTGHSLCAGGKGDVFARSQSDNFKRKDPFQAIPDSEIAKAKGSVVDDYGICVGDVMEFFWRDGVVEIEVGQKSVMKVEHELVGNVPKDTPVYALFDCAFAVCQATLLAWSSMDDVQ
jgi:hypothetical protein